MAIDIPPLRDHKEDIPALAKFFLERYAQRIRETRHQHHARSHEQLMEYHWPGNVRELQNIIERGVTLSAGTTLDAADIYLDDPAKRAGFRRAARPAARHDPRTMGRRNHPRSPPPRNGNKSQAARALGLSRNALRYRLSKLGVPDSLEEH